VSSLTTNNTIDIRVGMPLTFLTLPHICSCPKLELWFPMPYFMVLCVRWCWLGGCCLFCWY